MAVTANKRYLAVCERASKAVCTIYNLSYFMPSKKNFAGNTATTQQNEALGLKKKKVLVSAEYDANEFISADFSPQNEKLLVTLCGGKGKIIIWQWDKSRCLSFIDLDCGN